MKPRPLSRSLTFWSGILVMAFIVWAWRESVLRPFDLGFRRWGVCNAFSGVGFQRHPIYFMPSQFNPGLADELREALFPAPFYIMATGKHYDATVQEERERANSKEGKSLSDWAMVNFEYKPRGARLLFIPHWLIFLGFATIWCGLLVLRARRQGREKVILDLG